jgi:hypothetical protein
METEGSDCGPPLRAVRSRETSEVERVTLKKMRKVLSDHHVDCGPNTQWEQRAPRPASAGGREGGAAADVAAGWGMRLAVRIVRISMVYDTGASVWRIGGEM